MTPCICSIGSWSWLRDESTVDNRQSTVMAAGSALARRRLANPIEGHVVRAHELAGEAGLTRLGDVVERRRRGGTAAAGLRRGDVRRVATRDAGGLAHIRGQMLAIDSPLQIQVPVRRPGSYGESSFSRSRRTSLSASSLGLSRSRSSAAAYAERSWRSRSSRSERSLRRRSSCS